MKLIKSEIQERRIMSKKLSKDIADFDYFDMALIVLSATSVSIYYFYYFFYKYVKSKNPKYETVKYSF